MADKHIPESARAGSVPIRVLLIEDSAEDAQVVIRKLQKGGYDVSPQRVDTSSEIIESLSQNCWDLIICDYTLPQFSGHDALDIWRAKRCRAPFIFISGTLGEHAAVEALKQGASDYLLKDNLTRLIPAVDRALREVCEREERERERSRSEQNLRASEARFRALIENSSDGIFLLDQHGRILFSSSAVQRILGYQPSEIADGNFCDLVHSGDRAQAQSGLRCLPGEASTLLLRVLHRRGTWRVTECIFSNLLEESAVGGIIINFRDVTEAHLSAEALRESEEKFSKAFRSSPLAVTISTKAEGRYLDVNQAFLRMLGYERPEIIGKSSVQLGIWTKPEERDVLLRHLEMHSHVTGLPATFKTKTGELRETVIAAEPIEVAGTACVLAITQDVTETRRLEAQFRQAQKMEAVGQLAGGVAHDFNNLLMVMRSYAQMIATEGSNARIEEYTNHIIEAADKAAGVTRQLLAFSRRQPQELKRLDLNGVVRDFCAMLPGLLGEDIEFRVSTNARVGTVYADQGQIEQVIMNLAVNARDAMPSGGRLTIETLDVDLGENVSEHHGALIPPGRYVVVSVADTGQGMDEQTRVRLFEPFFTTKGTGKGTGLGLATAYGIVKQHQGFIWVYSEVGQGTIFKIYLPQWRGSDQPETTLTPAASTPVANRLETILVVEDQPALLEVTAKYLASAGYEVLKAADGNSALSMAAAHKRPIHLLLTDVVMPGIRGPELSARLTKLHPETRTVYMSGYTDMRSEGIDPSALVQKPIDLGLLARRLQQVLSGVT